MVIVVVVLAKWIVEIGRLANETKGWLPWNPKRKRRIER